MLKAIGAFLLLFWILSLLVHANGLAPCFGGSALVLLAADFVMSSKAREVSKRSRRAIN